MSLTLITAPIVEPVTEAEVWAHLRVPLRAGVPADRAHILNLMTWARETIDGRDGWLGRALVTQTWELTYCRLPGGQYIEMPLPPLQSIVSIKYIDPADGVQKTLSPTAYVVDINRFMGRLIPVPGVTWPQMVDDSLVIRFIAGNPPDKIPGGIKFALLMIIADMYEGRQSFQPMQAYSIPDDAYARLSQYRIWSFP